MQITENGKLVDKHDVWEHRLKASIEFFEVYRKVILDQVRSEWAKEGREVALYLWTFSPGDHEKNLCTLICWSDPSYPNQAVVNAPADELDKAYAWVIQHNPHLYFMGEPKIGCVADDFERASLTLVCKFKKRSA